MRHIFACVAFACLAVATNNPQLDAVHTVYLLHMTNSLDQYLANRLTSTGLLQVVTDPQKADAIFTDAIGEGFEAQMETLYPPPNKKKADKDSETDTAYGDAGQRFGSSPKGRGTVFLVDRRTRNVIWSVYSPIRGSRPDDTERRADNITKKLQSALKPKK